MLSCKVFVLLLQASASRAQFGNLNVQWDKEATTGGTTAQPRLASEALREYKASPDVRRQALPELSSDKLQAIVSGFAGASCAHCTTQPHWVSRVRHAVLDLPPKLLRAQLTKRGIKCEACTTREQLVDRLLDTVHLPPTS